VVLHSQLAISALDFLFRARPRDTKHLVIVAFSVTRQNRNLPRYENLAKR
jgi:hypothetical protein